MFVTDKVRLIVHMCHRQGEVNCSYVCHRQGEVNCQYFCRIQ
jgi:hypothetical protein